MFRKFFKIGMRGGKGCLKSYILHTKSEGFGVDSKEKWQLEDNVSKCEVVLFVQTKVR